MWLIVEYAVTGGTEAGSPAFAGTIIGKTEVTTGGKYYDSGRGRSKAVMNSLALFLYNNSNSISSDLKV